MIDPALQAAMAVFTDLGWSEAPIEQAPTLPLGTPEQRKIALAGLRSGQWGGFEPTDLGDQLGMSEGPGFGAVSWVSWVGPNLAMVSLFAIRVGVSSRRAGTVLLHCGITHDDVVAEVLAQRGERFCSSLIGSRGVWIGIAARLVNALELPIPQSSNYLVEWGRWAAHQLGVDWSHASPAEGAQQRVSARFVEHLQAAVDAAVPDNGLTAVFGYGIRQGWIGFDQAVELAFAGLDAASRPTDRKAWLGVLLDDLALSDQALVARADALVPLLAMGESILVERLAPALIAGVAEAGLIDVAVSSLTTPTKKAKLVVLKALAARPMPTLEVRQAVADQVAALASGRDAAVAKAANAVVTAWGLAELSDPVDKLAESVSGWWQPTPPLWTLPRFERGEVSAVAVTELAAVTIGRSSIEAVLSTEQFLAVANGVARKDPEAARAAVRGVTGWGPWVTWITDWRDGTRTGPFPDGSQSFLAARSQAVMLNLDVLPCVMSEPSFVDLSIDPADLVDRLRSYAKAGVSVQAADLFVALTRCDARLATAAVVAALRKLRVRVVTVKGKTLARHAGKLVAEYLADPVREPSLALETRTGFWRITLPPMPAAFARFGVNWNAGRNWSGDFTFMVFPTWGDAGLVNMAWGADLPAEAGEVHRQVVCRREPLTPGLAINLLAGPRACHPLALAEATQAVLEAWQRGLLQPGVADVALLDWRQPAAGLARFAATLLEFAEAGLASVVWPVLDDLLVAATKAPRLLSGAAEVAEAMEVLVPETMAAVGDGRAEAGVLQVPGVRALAMRPASSRAVAAARRVVAVLPEVEPPSVTSEDGVLDPPFEELWSCDAPGDAGSVIADGVVVRADWADAAASSRSLRFELELPGQPGVSNLVEPGVSFLVEKVWTWDLTHEGQCRATRQVDGAEPSTVWLHWDEASSAMVVAADRDWPNGADRPLESGAKTPLTSSLLTVAVGLAAQDGDNAWVGRHLITNLAEDGRLGAAGVAAAMPALLASPAISPARLAGVITRYPHLLGVLWPILTESVRSAGASAESLPRWLSIVLDVALSYAPYLREAAARGLMGEASAWPGLAEIAARPGRSATVAKAAQLQRALAV